MAMRFLLDTNVVIPLEPTSSGNTEPNTKHAAELIRLITENNHRAYLHPASHIDLNRDTDAIRRKTRLALLKKYSSLPDPPHIPQLLIEKIGLSVPGTNDHCDDRLIAALWSDAVAFLITEDKGIKRKAEKAGLGDRILDVLAAIQVISDLSEKDVQPPPTVNKTMAHSLDSTDPIFEGLRQDYAPGFDEWLSRCKLEHRTTWIIHDSSSQGIAAFCIVNEEKDPPMPLTGKVLKLCTFKVSQESLGFRFGELLLKTVFEHAFEKRYDWAFVTVFEHHPELIQLLKDFGFSRLNAKTSQGEAIFAKPMSVTAEDRTELNALEFHIRYGPRRFIFDENAVFLVPIQPQYADRLFPESMLQTELLHDNNPCGSALRKAYLCHSPTRALRPGNVLVFYRSQSNQGIIAVGVVENAFVSNNSEAIARKVAKRTVYSLRDIEQMCSKDVLVILFRQARVVWPPVSVGDMVEGRIMTDVPQSVMKIKKEGASWLQRIICQ